MKVTPRKVEYTFCPTCRKQVKFKIDWEGVAQMTSKGIITYKELYAFCPECGEEIYVPAVNDVNVHRRNKTYAEKVPESVQIPIAAGELAQRIEEQLKIKHSEEIERGKEILKEMFENDNSRCYKCARELYCSVRRDYNRSCPNYVRDPKDGGFYG